MEKTVEGWVILNAKKRLWSNKIYDTQDEALKTLQNHYSDELDKLINWIFRKEFSIVPATAVFRIEEKEGEE